MTTSERSMQMRLASHMSWAKTKDRSARTEAARKASHHTRFIEKARQMHPDGTEAEIAEAAESLKKAHYQALALRSVQARRVRNAEAKAAKQKRIARELAGAETDVA